ncbi:hypothetical protein ACV229_36875 [Burkholderia sp. MR1-5-21]
MVAHWRGATEARLDLLLDFVGVVVLEAGTCCAWYFAILRPVRPGRATVVYDPTVTVLQQEAVVAIPEATPAGRVEQTDSHAATVAAKESVANDSSPDPTMSEDDRLIAKIHEAVVAGCLTMSISTPRQPRCSRASQHSRQTRMAHRKRQCRAREFVTGLRDSNAKAGPVDMLNYRAQKLHTHALLSGVCGYCRRVSSDFV